MTRYDTNLASEFWVLSMRHRLGADASLTLGNKKTVDIVVTTDAVRAKTVDVKGVAGPYDWPADNIHRARGKNHYYVFVSFNGRIEDATRPPSAWVIPATRVQRFLRKYRTRTVVSRAFIRAHGHRYADGWARLVRPSAG
jgi:hypothetical protein